MGGIIFELFFLFLVYYVFCRFYWILSDTAEKDNNMLRIYENGFTGILIVMLCNVVLLAIRNLSVG
jgi:hypothetical protein